MSEKYLGATEEQVIFLEAVVAGDLKKVKQMIEKKGFDPNIGDDDTKIHINPICCASLAGNIEMAFYLIDSDKIKISKKLASYIALVVGDISTSNYIFDKSK